MKKYKSKKRLFKGLLRPNYILFLLIFLPEINVPALAETLVYPSKTSILGSQVTDPSDSNKSKEYIVDINFDNNDQYKQNYPQFIITNEKSTTQLNSLSAEQRANADRGDVFMVLDDGDDFYHIYNQKIYSYKVSNYSESSTDFVSPTYELTTSEDIPGYNLSGKTISAWQSYEVWESTFFPWAGITPVPPADVSVSSSSAVRDIRRGSRGSNGGWGAIFFPPGDGKTGGSGPSFTKNTTNDPLEFKYLEVGSLGGRGGDGGAAYACTCGGGDGAGGGKGGNITVNINKPGQKIISNSSHAVYAYSKSGQGGRGGGGYGAFSGGSGGGSPDGGNVTINNSATLVATTGTGNNGLFGFSASGAGGSGGAQYGLAGSAGSASGAADGGVVRVNNYGKVQTNGTRSSGILSQSVGGTGGSAGTSGNLFYSGGASGDTGGNGGVTSASNQGQILTQGQFSTGVFVQSIGGGGGNGGDAWGLVALGGTANSGGTGGDVSATNSSSGEISTKGKGSAGMFVQSVGGSGGSGGDSGGLVSLGGTGSKGASGGNVTITNAGSITTEGDHSRGIFAQSVGGGGGSGGRSGGMVSVGGSGSGGGNGKKVTLSSTGDIQTDGDFSEGIFAQSVGGGGGDGGSSTGVGLFAAVAVGGKAGSGSDGGEVDVTLGGKIYTGQSGNGYKSTGLFAQSVGGGGGTGGGAISASAGFVFSGSVSLGGQGGAGGDGGLVKLKRGGDSDIRVKGDHATGVFLQSVGGGGGDGGYAYSAAASAGPVSGTLTIGIGGDGGTGGEGGTVKVGGNFPSNPSLSGNLNPTTGFSGSIITDGRNSTGLFAQSVGGGGGNGGLSVAGGASASKIASLNVSIGLGGDGAAGGEGGTVSVVLGNTDITTKRVQSTGLIVQSVGGGGGNGGSTVSAGLGVSLGGSANVTIGNGGNASGGGDGGVVNVVTGSGTITTKGEKGSGNTLISPLFPYEIQGNSPGVIVQSVGGGGGNGGYSIAGAVAAGGVAAGNVTVGLGGKGGTGGDGKTVFAKLGSNVITESDNSSGILVQSVGGGGGNGGFSISVSGQGAGVGAGGINVGIGGKGSGGGSGSSVQASSAGSIVTKGSNSTAFTAQSIGGGGGNGGYSITGGLSGGGTAAGAISVGLGGEAGSGNSASSVTAITNGNIQTGQENSNTNNSPGIVAQSIGGGGGNGGFNITANANGAGVAAGSVNVGIGGKGGSGSSSGVVNLTVNNNVITYGESSTAITAQSIGGGGGNGGFNISAGAAVGISGGAGNVAVGLGGEGGAGGSGKNVTSSIDGDIDTYGDESAGSVVQSIGGGGGNGGFNISGTVSLGGVGSGGITVGLGGSGGSGNSSGNAVGDVKGSIHTRGKSSPGFIVQSIGGGGGNGGFNISGSLSGSTVGSGSINVGLGGSGATGGTPGEVRATSNSEIITEGIDSGGILAQSIGGGGGSGGFNISAGASAAGKGSGNINVGLGGDGGQASNANKVILNSTKIITTKGQNSNAITAQSIGGGGGNGGFNISAGIAGGLSTGSGTIQVGLGGSGGEGGDGKNVEVNSSGNIRTEEIKSDGILAQSVGGGGGNGGFNISAGLSVAGGGSGGISVGLGGSGAGGGNSGSVELDVDNNVTTLKNNSSAIVAQSIGGGGGSGAFNVSATFAGAAKGSGAISVGLGGSGGTGGQGHNINADISGSINTSGTESKGILAQSIGGGGGAGAFDVTGSVAASGSGSIGASVSLGGSGGGGGISRNVDLTKTKGNIKTEDDDSSAVVSQSIGGGGGSGGFSVNGAISASKNSAGVSLGIGGSGGGGGNAGNVTNIISTSIQVAQAGDIDQNNDNFKDNNGYIETSGNKSKGILAQSIGGGGGNGGFNITGAVSLSSSAGGAVGLGFGGSGGDGGDGGTVNNTFIGEYVKTLGNESSGIVAQSLGGGGGDGGININGQVSLGIGSGNGSLGVGFGGSGGDGGSGGIVNNASYGNIQTGKENSTRKYNSPGIVAQSIGGGGGNGALNITGNLTLTKGTAGSIGIGFGGSGGDGGISQKVTNNSVGDITTWGEKSSAVTVQSIGGGGGNGALNITGNLNATLSNGGAGSFGLGFGGNGGSGSSAGDAESTVTGNISTNSLSSDGIKVQSFGGGGGDGGLNVTGNINISKKTSGSLGIGFGGNGGSGSSAGIIKNDLTGIVSTKGENSTGLLSQSIGGGGGNGGMNITGTIVASSENNGGALSFGFGGSGSSGGTASSVTNEILGKVVTTGKNSTGILSQSIGGGGGNGSLNTTAAVTLTKKKSGALAFGLGGIGGGGGSAGSVNTTFRNNLDNDIAVKTSGFDSPAIKIQSIGGGGGNGGMNVSGTVNLSGDSGASVGLGVGGFGGGSGNSSAVTLDSTGNLETSESNSDGIIAQSIGGGGGDGGLNISGSLQMDTGSSSTATAASVGIGGFGGNGGNSGKVDVTHTGDIVTSKSLIKSNLDMSGSYGLVASSQGGSGGLGAINISGALQLASQKSDGAGLVIGVGGYGGGGGDASNVNVRVNKGSNKGTISTKSTGKSGVLVKSIGGGGGDGGINISGGITADNSINIGVGGSGQDGGIAGNVIADINSDIQVTPSQSGFTYNAIAGQKLSAGLLAQSIGGGGGNGGMNITGGINFSNDKNALNFGIGGGGGSGSVSGLVDVDLIGDVLVSGNYVSGINAQSIGGGGGNGGMNITGTVAVPKSSASPSDKKNAAISVGIGGAAGDGAISQNVSVNHTGSVTTGGADRSTGIIAQSLGGGGGRGGININGLIVKSKNPITFNVGGSGGNGSNSGKVEVIRGSSNTPTGKISTIGKNSHGLEASSIGGGGGTAGMTIAGTLSAGQDDKSKQTQVTIGGNGGTGSDGNEVDVENNSDISTKGLNSHGLLAQSIGGGGGNANYNLSVLLSKNNQQDGKQMINTNIAIGGQPGSAGNGDKVNVVQRGKITTEGKASHAGFAQSIGGGGGNAGTDLALEKSKVSGGKSERTSLEFTLGRQGGSGGSGGDVDLNAAGNFETKGFNSYGLFAQSIGGGGGNSSTTSIGVERETGAKTPTEEEHSAVLKIGIEGGSGGTGGNVNLSTLNNSNVKTLDEFSHGLFAQSIGGGGGNAASSVVKPGITRPDLSLLIGGTGGTGGTSGDVLVDSNADITTSKKNSSGIFAQSAGGGGGQGSDVYSVAIVENEMAANVALGGIGGKGNTSGTVTIKQVGSTLTKGNDSHGLFAQSIGGGGGNAGSVIQVFANKKDSKRNISNTKHGVLSLSIGRAGGEGGFSKKVIVENTGNIETEGNNSHGIFAKSIGGGGGNAGFAISGKILKSNSDLSISVGGSGGIGSVGGEVEVTNKSGSIITTNGDTSDGIRALSIGGGGGNGGASISAVLDPSITQAKDTTSEFNATYSIGGKGGQGGQSSNVLVNNYGEIIIKGKEGNGIFAQSIGGGGGNGGMSISGNIQLGGVVDTTEKFSKSTIAIGGSGGDGNTSGDVTVNNTGKININNSLGKYGIFAQSIGGGGGNGAFAINATPSSLNPRNPYKQLTNVSLGGFGGNGADSGDVTVNSNGSGQITTYADNSYAIFAQSIGGGGGNSTISYGSPLWTASDFGLKNLLGGGSKGTAGKVTVNVQNANIKIHGKNSSAVLSQSINGGGGNINTTTDFSSLESNTPVIVTEISYLLGSQNVNNVCSNSTQVQNQSDNFNDGTCSWEEVQEKSSSGGAAGNVLTPNSQTQQLETVQVQNQNVELKNLSANSINDQSSNNIESYGDNSTGVKLQSIGGGGGTGYLEHKTNEIEQTNLEVSLGALGVSESHGNKVDSVRNGNISINGKDSTGILIQSIGGGGGEYKTYNKTIESQNTDDLDKSIMTLGSNNSVNNNGEKITLENTGSLTISGENSQGIILQSIGGGGGKISNYGFDSAEVTFGGTANSSGDGGIIDLTNKGDITQSSDGSYGIIAQSIGGGGGIVFTDLTMDNIQLKPPSALPSGSGSKVKIIQDGNININGNNSFGILAQSIGGGGGSLNPKGSSGGIGNSNDVEITLNSNINSQNTVNTIGVYAQSDASSNQQEGNISVTLNSGNHIHVSDTSTAIQLSDGLNNAVNINGEIKALTSYPINISKVDRCLPKLWICNAFDGKPDGYVLKASSGNETVINTSDLYGNLDLGTGKGNFNNSSTGTLISGQKLLMGSTTDSEFTNNGLISPGGTYIYKTEIGGSFIHNENANLDIDLDFSTERENRADSVDVLIVSNTAKLNGDVNLLTRSIPLIKPGIREIPFVTTSNGVLEENLTLNVPSSAIARYGIITDPSNNPQTSSLRSDQSNNTTLLLNVNFEGFGDLNKNQTSIGNYFNRVQEYQPTQELAQFITSIFNLPDSNGLRSAYDSISPEVFSSNTRSIYDKSSRFLDRLQSCDSNTKFISQKEESCFWYDAASGHSKYNDTDEFFGFKNNSSINSFGLQFKLNENNFLGFAVEDSSFSNSFSKVSTDIKGDLHQFSTTYKKKFDKSQISIGANYGKSTFKTERRNVFPLLTNASSETSYESFSIRTQASHSFTKKGWEYVPSLGLEYTQIYGDPFKESGSGPLNLEVGSTTNEFLRLSPALQVGTKFKKSNIVFEPKLRYGFNTYINKNFPVVTKAKIEGAPDEVDYFYVSDNNDRDYQDLTFRLDFYSKESLKMNLQFKNTFSANTYSNETSVGFIWKFD